MSLGRSVLGVLGAFALMASVGCSASQKNTALGGSGGPVLEPFAGLSVPAPTAKVVTVSAPKTSYRSAWRDYLKTQRNLQIARLRDYRDAGEFAQNQEQGGLRFVWRDEAGRLCAMANLVAQSGRNDLVDEVARDHNDLQLATVTSGELYDWMLESGLTQEEVQLIQEPDFAGGRFEQPPSQVSVKLPQTSEQQAWFIRRKRAHLDSVVDRLDMDFDASLEMALDRLGDRLESAPPLG
ncbi:MAG: hypothetical protein U0271_36535 [Polyangiaceae bacterium]